VSRLLFQSEWLTADNPEVLLNLVRPPVTWPAVQPPPTPAMARRLQLFGCACARMVWEFLPTDARSAVLIRERFAEGRATEDDVKASAPQIQWAAVTYQQHALNATADPRDAARNAAKALATRAAGPVPADRSAEERWHALWNPAYAAARKHQAELVRDIFPPPGHAPALHSDWRTSTVVALARQMDDTGDFSAVPILADALQDAGCDNDAMLDRCRAASGVHCRGNWVVDLVLGRE
jgi:hypothetical protein